MEKTKALNEVRLLNWQFLKFLSRSEQITSARFLIEELIKSCTDGNYESIGLLEIIKQNFIDNAEEKEQRIKNVVTAGVNDDSLSF